MTLLSVFAGGLWIIPLITFFGGIYSFYRAYRQHNSNSTQSTKDGIKDNTGNVPYTQIGAFWYGVGLVLSTIVIVILMVNDK